MKKERSDAIRFFERILMPLILISGGLFYVSDRIVRDRVIFQTEIQGASKIHRMMHRRHHELPILGSSRALGSYIPDSLGIRSYNYGINGTGFEVLRMMLEIELKRKGSHMPIVINFDYQMWNHALGDMNSYIANVGHAPVRDLLKRVGKDDWKYHVPGVRFFGQFDFYVKDYINGLMQLTKVTNRGASLEKNELSPAEFERLVAQRLASKDRYAPIPSQVAWLDSAIDAHPERLFLFVLAPLHESFYASFEGLGEARAYLDSMDARGNVMVMDFDGRNYPDSLYLNTTHVNLAGARRFSSELRKAIFGSQTGDDPIPLIWPEGYEPDWFREEIRRKGIRNDAHMPEASINEG